MVEQFVFFMATTTIQQLILFQDLSPAQYAILQRLFSPRYEPQGAVIFEQGETASALYILVAGKIDIRFKPEDGTELTMTHVRCRTMLLPRTEGSLTSALAEGAQSKSPINDNGNVGCSIRFMADTPCLEALVRRPALDAG